MRTFTDQLGREIRINYPPQRIISLVPSQTELLFDLGLANRVVGVTKFCNHPADKVKHVPKVGGTKQLNFDAIQTLKPDLIIGNKEENEQQQMEFLMKHYPVWMSDIFTLDDALKMITDIGLITDTRAKADNITSQISEAFAMLKPSDNKLRVVYLIWRKPFMVAGPDTFINDMLQRCGFTNAVERARYPELSIDEIQAPKPAVVLLSSEPYPFRDKHIAEFKNMLPDSQIRLVDGEMFSWYGSRLAHAPDYFKQLIIEVEVGDGN